MKPTVECLDTDNGATDSNGEPCSSGYYDDHPEECGVYDKGDFSSATMRRTER